MPRSRLFGTWVVVLAAGSLCGCAGATSIAPEAAGLGAGAGAGVLTANPLIGVAVGLGARLAAAEAIGAIQASHQRELQHAIASAAGQEAVGETTRWYSEPSAVNRLLFGSISGSVQVAREFGGRIRCREILYTTDDDGGVLGLADAAEAELESNTHSGDAAPVSEPDHGDATVGEGETVSSADSDHPKEPEVLVAVICRGATVRDWRWAVSEPAG